MSPTLHLLLKVLKVGLVGITSGQQYLVRPPFRLGDNIFADSTPVSMNELFVAGL